MKENVFGLDVVFDHHEVDRIIEDQIKAKVPGYVVSLSFNNVAVSQRDDFHRNVLNGSTVTFSDSSYFAMMANLIHHKGYKGYCSADMFEKIVKSRKYKQYFLGANEKILSGLRDNLSKWDPAIKDMKFEELPFRKVEEFDYEGIAKRINMDCPDIIWVSLGAPKQEQFMARLKPYLTQGLMFGWGALFNFYSGLDDAPSLGPNWMRKLHLIWLYRCLTDKRVRERNKKNIQIIPKMLWREWKKKHS